MFLHLCFAHTLTARPGTRPHRWRAFTGLSKTQSGMLTSLPPRWAINESLPHMSAVAQRLWLPMLALPFSKTSACQILRQGPSSIIQATAVFWNTKDAYRIALEHKFTWSAGTEASFLQKVPSVELAKGVDVTWPTVAISCPVWTSPFRGELFQGAEHCSMKLWPLALPCMSEHAVRRPWCTSVGSRLPAAHSLPDNYSQPGQRKTLDELRDPARVLAQQICPAAAGGLLSIPI